MPKLDSYKGHGLVEKAVAARAKIPQHLIMPNAGGGFDPYLDWHEPVGIDIRMYNHAPDAWHIITPLRDSRLEELHRREGHRFITLSCENHGDGSTPDTWAFWDDPLWTPYTANRERPYQTARFRKGANIAPEFYRWLYDHIEAEML